MRIKQRKKGFGILEVLISALIIAIILAALIAVARTSLRGNEFYLQRMQATYLAQQNLEIARQIRDTNWIDKNNATQWDTFNAMDVTPISIFDSSAGKIGYFQYVVPTDTTKSRYSFKADSSAPTYCGIPSSTNNTDVCKTFDNVKYQRSVEFATVPDLLKAGTTTDAPAVNSTDLKNAIKVTSRVRWQNSGGATSSVDVSEILTNWRPNF